MGYKISFAIHFSALKMNNFLLNAITFEFNGIDVYFDKAYMVRNDMSVGQILSLEVVFKILKPMFLSFV